MKHYRVTEELRDGLNEYFGINYIKGNDVGKEIYHLDHYNQLANISPYKAKLLMATLFPEEVSDFSFLATHRGEILNLANKLHVEPSHEPTYNWCDYMVRRETLPGSWSGFRDEDIFTGNIVRFR